MKPISDWGILLSDAQLPHQLLPPSPSSSHTSFLLATIMHLQSTRHSSARPACDFLRPNPHILVMPLGVASPDNACKLLYILQWPFPQSMAFFAPPSFPCPPRKVVTKDSSSRYLLMLCGGALSPPRIQFSPTLRYQIRASIVDIYEVTFLHLIGLTLSTSSLNVAKAVRSKTMWKQKK